MRIDEENGIIEFKTVPPFFQREKDGRKTNTVRRLDDEKERQALLSSLFGLSKIRIVNAVDLNSGFERILTDITYYDERFIFSWNHAEGD